MFEETKISVLFYIIIVVVSLFVLTAAGLYLLWIYHLGKPLAPFFWLRIKSWTQRNIALFEIFSLTNSVSLEEARKETGDGYRLYTPTTVEIAKKKEGFFKRKWNFLFGKSSSIPTGTEKIKRLQNLIMPKSTYSINGVNTIPLWDLHPQLHTDILEGIKILISQNIKTLKQFTEFVENKDNAEKPMFKNYNYRTFYDLYLGVRQKFHVNICTNDIIGFVGTNFDKHYRESIEAKDFNLLQFKKQEGKTTLYGYIIIGIIVAAVAFKIVYRTIYG